MDSWFLRVLFFLLSCQLAGLFVLLSNCFFVTLDVNFLITHSKSRASALLCAATVVQLVPSSLSRACPVPVSRWVQTCSQARMFLLSLLFKLAEVGVRAG